MRRKELGKQAYNIFRTRIDIPGSPTHWEVSTIDVQKLYEKIPFRIGKKHRDNWGNQHGYETLVFQGDEDQVSSSEEKKSGAKKEKIPDEDHKVFYYQAYQTLEEARFGHEEIVYSILNGQIFLDEGNELADYVFLPDSGENVDIKDPLMFLDLWDDLEEDSEEEDSR